MAKTINTRIALKIDTLTNWNASTFIPLAGEVCIAKVDTIEGSSLQPVMIKVGDGVNTFSGLDWMSAKAADVYGWAKAAKKPTYTADEIEGLGDYINGEIQDTDNNTTYAFDLSEDGKLVITATPHVLGEAGEETVVATLELVSDAEFAEYKTANDAEVAKKLNAS